MKKYSFGLAIIVLLLSFTACKKGPNCPAYDSVHNSKDHAYNPNNAKRAKEDNKKDIEKRKDAALNEKPAKRKNSYSLFPKGLR
jgi:hypothetical protein